MNLKDRRKAWVKSNKKGLIGDNTFFLLGALIIAMIILNAFEIFSQVKHESVEKIGNGVLLVTKQGEKFINYTITETGFFGRSIEKNVIVKFDENLSKALIELSNLKNAELNSEFEKSNEEISNSKNTNNESNNTSSTYNKEVSTKNKTKRVLALWNNGHPIQAITGFDTVFYSPSSEYLFFSKDKKWDSELLGKFSDSQDFKSFSNIIIYGSINELWEFAKANDCSYIFLSENDLYEFPYLFSYVNGKYLNKKEDILLNGIKNSLLYQLLLEKELKQGCDNSKFDLIYSDSNSRIFRVC